MTDPSTVPSAGELPAQISDSLESLWTLYSGKQPGRVDTLIQGDVVTTTLSGGVVEFSEGMIAPPSGEAIRIAGKVAGSNYRDDAVAAVFGLTHQRVASLVSAHDRGTDVATEVFTLEPAPKPDAPPPEAPAFTMPPASPIPPASPMPPASPIPPRGG